MTRTQTVAQCRQARLRPWQTMRCGVRLLNRVMPDWRGYVNPRTLDMGHDERCVLAQIAYDEDSDIGTYSDGLHIVGIERGWRYGFDIMAMWGRSDRAYDRLTAQWVLYLTGHLIIREVGMSKTA